MFRPPLPLVLVLLCGLTTVRADDENSFATVPSEPWQRVEPLKEVGYDLAGYDFSAQTCRITCGVPPAEAFALYGIGAFPRANLLGPTEFVDAVASVDLVAWQPPQPGLLDGSFPAVFTRIQPTTGFGKTTGFSLALQTLQDGIGRLRIYLSFQESLYQLGESATFTLDPSRTYRLVLASHGELHTGRIFDLAAPAAPVASVTVQTAFLGSDGGRCGFGVAMPHPLPIDVTFDNFLAWDGSPPPLTIRQGTAPGTIELLSDTRRTMASDLETTTDLTDPLAPWLSATAATATTSGETLIRTFPLDGPRAFFRGKRL